MERHLPAPSGRAGRGANLCDYPLARNLIQFAVALASEAVVRFVLEGQQEGYSFTLPDLRTNREGGVSQNPMRAV